VGWVGSGLNTDIFLCLGLFCNISLVSFSGASRSFSEKLVDLFFERIEAYVVEVFYVLYEILFDIESRRIVYQK